MVSQILVTDGKCVETCKVFRLFQHLLGEGLDSLCEVPLSRKSDTLFAPGFLDRRSFPELKLINTKGNRKTRQPLGAARGEQDCPGSYEETQQQEPLSALPGERCRVSPASESRRVASY